MSRNLSQMVADLFASTTDNRGLLSQVQRVGEEIRKALHSDETLFGRFNGLLESLRAILPDEQQRFQAALKTIATTSKLSRQEIIDALSGQLEELKIIEQRLQATVQAWRDGLRGREARAVQVRGEIAQLRLRLGQLESEELGIEARRMAQGHGPASAGKTVTDIFADLRTEIGSIKTKFVELTSDPAAERAPGPLQPRQHSGPPAVRKGAGKNLVSVGSKGGSGKKTGSVQDRAGGPGEAREAPMPAGEQDAASEGDDETTPNKGASRSGSQPGARKKSCPVCYKQMIWSPGEKVWRCPSGHHEIRSGGKPGSKRP